MEERAGSGSICRNHRGAVHGVNGCPMSGEVQQKRGNTVRTDRARDTFAATLQATCNVSESCRAAGISRSVAYVWREEDEVFARAWQEAEDAAADMLEQVAFERAQSGQSDRMLEILLKAHRPKYRDKQAIEVSGPNGGPIEHREAAKREVEDLFGPTPHLIEVNNG